ncbi:MAG: hypothetical protein SAJ12_02110 [Jaaginema sp. PMC 1079.18]|nr:hypothetical protein [Jaaginema sp. PMC 1080.18]MEC4849782.1 hypothetical protein [Jaaginema sp. PMC 1079.18]MEC4865707.1 hypothetical protein [Jaaginema sp. PMC 1078.18]
MAIIPSESGIYQQIFGTVYPDGNSMSGEGFNVRKLKEGTYVVEFERPFYQNPAVVCTIMGHEWKTFNMSIAILEIQPQYFVCSTSPENYPMDCAFSFIAMGAC